MSSRSGEVGGEAELGEDRDGALRSQGCNEDIQGSSPTVDPGAAAGLRRSSLTRQWPQYEQSTPTKPI